MNLKTTAAAAIAATMMAGGAQATTVDSPFVFEGTNLGDGGGNSGNYCANFESGTDDVCNVNGSPWIVKYDLIDDDDDDNFGNWIITAFNTVFGNEADFGGITIDEVDNQWGFTYNANSNDPGITAFSAKGGAQGSSGGGNNLFVLADGEDPFFGGQRITFTFPQGNSNITFFDSDKGDTPVIPLPAAGWLMLAGIGGLAAMRRRKKA